MKIVKVYIGDNMSVKSAYRKLKDFVQGLIDKSGENIKMATVLTHPGNPDLGASLHVHAPKSKYRQYDLLASINPDNSQRLGEDDFAPGELTKAMSYARKRFEKFLTKIK